MPTKVDSCSYSVTYLVLTDYANFCWSVAGRPVAGRPAASAHLILSFILSEPKGFMPLFHY